MMKLLYFLTGSGEFSRKRIILFRMLESELVKAARPEKLYKTRNMRTKKKKGGQKRN